MSKKIKRLLAALVAAFCVLAGSAAPAFAYVDPTWEESAEGETTGEEVIVEEPAAEETPAEGTDPEAETEQAFSTPGNGDLGDEITSGMKDFYTIHTKNNNTFYLVIDHSGSTDNVYMLSLIDEDDLSEFLGESVEETEAEAQIQEVIVPETETVAEPETEPAETTEPEEGQGNNSGMVTLAVLAVIGIGAAAYYFKVYKPKKEADGYESEGLETDDGLDTENEDQE